MSYLEPPSDPVSTFAAWYEEAVRSGAPFPDAMTLATVGPGGQPSARIVLYKGLRQDKLCFVSNYHSRKGRELEQHPRAALVFFWPTLDRQVRFEGEVERAPAEVSDAYFASRDRESQLGAWASEQSAPIASRPALLERLAEAELRFAGRDVERPAHWGMYLFDPKRVELWISAAHRLHDRFAYERRESGWHGERLSP